MSGISGDVIKDLLSNTMFGPSHAYIIESLYESTQEALTENLLGKITDKQTSLVEIAPESDTISIDTIRELYTKTSRKKVVGDSNFWQVVIIKQANTMTVQAQNALLKLLEEPTPGVLIVLTATDKSRLLPTIRSRCLLIKLGLLPRNLFDEAMLQAGHDENTSALNYIINNGDLIESLNNTFALDQTLVDAKSIFRLSLGEALVLSTQYAKDRIQATKFVESILVIIKSAIWSNTDVNKYLYWSKKAEITMDSRQLIEKSNQYKLILSNLIVHLRLSTID